jgi:ribosome biogenesis GTPase / thiamine phosphate phosphatase
LPLADLPGGLSLPEFGLFPSFHHIPFLRRLGADDDVVSALSLAPTPGRVVRAERGGALVATAAGDVATPYAEVTVGDWVSVADGSVRTVLPRRGVLIRADPAGRSTGQVLAANVDTVLICTPLTADPPIRRLERLLAVAWGSDATPVLVATKADLSTASLAPLAAAAPGIDVVATAPQDVRGLAPYLGPGRTCALLGSSGVGKSTLVNMLLGREAMSTQPIRSDGKGRHTTTWRELVVLPDGGALIDTPGLRGVGLAAVDADGVSRAFADLEDLAVDCRFSDCRHAGEPGCAVSSAVDAGVLDGHRVESHRRLQRELEWQAAKSDDRLRAERNRRWRTVTKQNRTKQNRTTQNRTTQDRRRGGLS